MALKDPIADESRPFPLIGWREWLALPQLGLKQIKAKVDTGARTSALHAFQVEKFVGPDGSDWVRFGMHPKQRTNNKEIFCEAAVHDMRVVTDSGGHREERFVIVTDVVAGGHQFPIEMTLTARDDMRFRMLLGRTALADRFCVDSGQSYLLGKKKKSKRSQDSEQ